MSDYKNTIINIIASENGLGIKPVENVIKLLEEGSTVPFISRYRKELTSAMNEQDVSKVKSSFEKLSELIKRRQTILDTIGEQGKLTKELESKILDCYDANKLEDIYLPYKPKRKTKASVAREKGLEPLAAIIMKQNSDDISGIARRFINQSVSSVEKAIEGAGDIIAEWVSENDRSREQIRKLFSRKAVIYSKVNKSKTDEAVKYTDYFDFSQQAAKIPSHRLLALLRGEKEGMLKIGLHPEQEEAIELLERIFIRNRTRSAELVKSALTDSYKRLLKPSIETETLAGLKLKADEEAIRVFARNLRQLLLSPPLGQKRLIAIDPGFRTGCKVVCLSSSGMLLHNDVIYPHPPQNKADEAKQKITGLINKYRTEAIAIGDGTAGRETEAFIKSMKLDHIPVIMVNEDGASIYSASTVAREEFPDQDITVRGAVSIGRRLIDPLAELVKIDPKSIGVGQYQHDVDQSLLRSALEEVVISCVNYVGVNLNTASAQLLSYVSGLGSALAKKIVEHRQTIGHFTSRAQLLEVPRLGNKAFEQCAGFLRIDNADNPLDNSAVHPESYYIVERMAEQLNVTVRELLQDKQLQKSIEPEKYVTERTGLHTVNDIIAELSKPGRDPRGEITPFSFAENISSIEDLREGIELPGLVTNITNFGVFVNIGVKEDGLVHISQLADRYVADPNDIVKLQQKVMVRITAIDTARKRISLAMKGVIQ